MKYEETEKDNLLGILLFLVMCNVVMKTLIGG